MPQLMVKNAKLVTGGLTDVLIVDDKIAAVGHDLTVDETMSTLDLAGEHYLSAGWIDDHVHCYEKMTLYYDFPDKVGVETGVTSIIDAGSTGANNIGDFYELAQKAKTNVFALINISQNGIVAQDELADMKKIDHQLVRRALAKYPDFIRGIKARMSRSVVGANDVLPLIEAKKIQKENGELPLMVHIGSAPPELEDVLNLLEAGDVVTHCYNGKTNGIMTTDERIKDFVKEAYQKGVLFDVGHGTDSFNFRVAEIAKKENFIPGMISTDIYHRNRENGPVYNMATTLEKLWLLGYELPDLIKMITENPAKIFKLPNKGHLESGYDADLTIFDLDEGAKELVDSNKNERQTTQLIKPIKTIIGGQVYNVKS